MKKKITALVLVAAMMAALAGCGGTAAPADASFAADASSVEEASSAEEASEALADGVLTAGTNAAFPPFEYVGDDGKPEGFDIALIRAIGEKLGVEVEVRDMEFDSLVTSIGSKIDVAIAGMTVTEERKAMVTFSDPYYDAVQYVILPAGSSIASIEDLKGKNIGCQLGTTGNYLIEDSIEGAAAQTYNKAIDAVNDLINGKLEAVIIDQNPAEVFVKNHPDEIRLIPGADFGFEAEQYAIAMPKDDAALAEAVNAALAELRSDGSYDALVEQYINSSEN
ncbi:transporter substrate-binding domain-containing protein [Lachnoclostridium sp. Marseille-P6806]|uniref:transporter substrate-binding domain-containing protein n=1 Tax=Lachnoclostridium sp. Marseille-P6806 TaxID=2364793 RepID=UPI001031F794|nr:transporter substrate-binding domain-containing protein [Lachnoclostridium sp. Marseille-P6806]